MSFVTILLLSLSGSPASADKVAAPEPPAVFLKEGVPAPYDGQFMTIPRAITLGQRVERCEFLRAMDANLFQKAGAIDIRLAVSNAEIDLAVERKKSELLEEALSVPWYKQAWFIVLITAAGTYGLIRGAKALP